MLTLINYDLISQTYKINGEKAIHLNPRPQSKDAKPSTKSKFGGTCEACGRYLQDLPNRFCSIACKVERPNPDFLNSTWNTQQVNEMHFA
jgi:hypothetical protein